MAKRTVSRRRLTDKTKLEVAALALFLSAAIAFSGFSFSDSSGITAFATVPDKCMRYIGDQICDDTQENCGPHYIRGISHEECNECQRGMFECLKAGGALSGERSDADRPGICGNFDVEEGEECDSNTKTCDGEIVECTQTCVWERVCAEDSGSGGGDAIQRSPPQEGTLRGPDETTGAPPDNYMTGEYVEAARIFGKSPREILSTLSGDRELPQQEPSKTAELYLEDRYIVEFKEEPVIEKVKDKIERVDGLEKEIRDLKEVIDEDPWDMLARGDKLYKEGLLQGEKTAMKTVASSQKSVIRSKVEQLEMDLGANRITGAATDGETVIENEFNTIFAGASVKATPEKIDEIKTKSYVKGVHRDVPVFMTREDDRSKTFPITGQVTGSSNSDDCEGDGCLTGEGVTIAIIDSGVDYTHQDLGGCFGSGCKVIGGYDFVNNDNDPMDDDGHGTHVAATAAGKDTTYNGRFDGTAPDAKILAYKVLNENGSGPSSYTFAAIEAAVDPNKDGDLSDRADIISLSLGMSATDMFGYDVMKRVNDAGLLFVVAAGNDGYQLYTISSPGAFDFVLTVGASCTPENSRMEVCKNRVLARFSSRGPENFGGTSKPDVAAPGVNICAALSSLVEKGNFCYDGMHIIKSGTSMATPYVSGLAARVLQKHPDWAPQQVKDAIKDIASPVQSSEPDVVYSNMFGAGILDKDSFSIGNTTPQTESRITGVSDPFAEPDDTITVRGIARGSGFEGYEIAVMDDLGSGWRTIHTSSSKVETESEIASVELSDFQGNTVFIRLRVTGSGEIRDSYATVMIYRNRDLIGKGPGIGFFSVSPTVSDIDGDGIPEAITLSENRGYTGIYAFKGRRLMAGWPQFFYTTFTGFPVSTGDIDGDGLNDIIFDNALFKHDEQYIYAFRYDGTLIDGWPVAIPQNFMELFPQKATDIDNDGGIEVLKRNIFSYDLWVVDSTNKDKYILGGTLQDDFATPEFGSNRPIILSYDETKYKIPLQAHELDTNTMETTLLWEKETSSYRDDVETSPILIDVNGDDEADTIMIYSDLSEDGSLARSIRADGTVINNKKITSRTFDNIFTNLESAPAAAVSNGEPVIVFRIRNKIYVIDKDLNVLREIDSEGITSPILINVDADDELEIVGVAGSKSVYAWNLDGSLVYGYPKKIFDGNGFMSTYAYGHLMSNDFGPAAGDIDGDGLNEILVNVDLVAPYNTVPSFLWVIDTEGRPVEGEWTQYMGGPGHTGYAGKDVVSTLVGDINRDGTVNSVDASIVLSYVSDISVDYDVTLENADVNRDGQITRTDAKIILVYVVGAITELPYVRSIGDVNFDGNIDSRDALSVLQHVEGNFLLNNVDSTFADVNEDERISRIDSSIILLYTTDAITDLPYNRKVGDVNFDGAVNSNDAKMIRDYLSGASLLTNIEKVFADVNEDGEVTQADADAIGGT